MIYKELNSLNRKINIVYLLVIFLIALVTRTAIIDYIDGSTFRDVKSGKVKLYCDTGRGHLIIDPNKITAYIDGVFYFNNGYATKCELIR